jgi:hypothetical protein
MRKGAALRRDDRFTDEEWADLVGLPRWLVAAASAACHDNAYRTEVENEVGLLATARGRDRNNEFLAVVAEEALNSFDSQDVIKAISFRNRNAGIDAVLARAEAVSALLSARVPPVDARAYRKWLLAIVDAVIRAAHSGISIWGSRVSKPEQALRDRLAALLHL